MITITITSGAEVVSTIIDNEAATALIGENDSDRVETLQEWLKSAFQQKVRASLGQALVDYYVDEHLSEGS